MDRAKTDHLLVETEAAFQGRSAAATPVRAVGKHSLPISTAGNWFALESLCQVESVLALATDRISNISATPSTQTVHQDEERHVGRFWQPEPDRKGNDRRHHYAYSGVPHVSLKNSDPSHQSATMFLIGSFLNR